jgi:hypothetical protein
MSSMDFQTRKSQIIPEKSQEVRSPSISPRKRDSLNSRVSPKDREKFKHLVNMAGELGQKNDVGLIMEVDDEEFEEYSKEMEESISRLDKSNVHFSPFKPGSSLNKLQSPGIKKQKILKVTSEERMADVKCYNIG